MRVSLQHHGDEDHHEQQAAEKHDPVERPVVAEVHEVQHAPAWP